MNQPCPQLCFIGNVQYDWFSHLLFNNQIMCSQFLLHDSIVDDGFQVQVQVKYLTQKCRANYNLFVLYKSTSHSKLYLNHLQVQEQKPRHVGGRRVLSPLCPPLLHYLQCSGWCLTLLSENGICDRILQKRDCLQSASKLNFFADSDKQPPFLQICMGQISEF